MARAAEARRDGRIVSVSTALFDGYPMDRAIEEIARAGARYVEPAYIRGYVDFDETAFEAGAARHLRSLVEAAGLGLHAVSAHMDLSQADGATMLGRRIGFAAELGARVLITNAGPATGRGRILAVIRSVLPRLEAWGGMLAIENPGHGVGNLVGNAAEGRLLVEAIGSTHVRLNHDAGNVHSYSRGAVDPAQDYRGAADAIGHAHLKDIQATPEGWSFCPLGEGDVDLTAYLAALPAALPLSIELPLRLTRPGRGDPVRMPAPLMLGDLRGALAQSLAFLSRYEPDPDRA